MKEAGSLEEFNPLTRRLYQILGDCGYDPLPSRGSSAQFTRPVDPSHKFPRFNLGIHFDDHDEVRTSFSLQNRPYHDQSYSQEISIEIKRIIEIVEEQRKDHPYSPYLLSALRHRLLFEMADHVEGYKKRFGVEMSHQLEAKLKRRKLLKDKKALWFKHKYEEEAGDIY